VNDLRPGSDSDRRRGATQSRRLRMSREPGGTDITPPPSARFRHALWESTTLGPGAGPRPTSAAPPCSAGWPRSRFGCGGSRWEFSFKMPNWTSTREATATTVASRVPCPHQPRWAATNRTIPLHVHTRESHFCVHLAVCDDLLK